MASTYIKKISEPTEIDIIIPCAGLGKRMKSYGPKPLIKIKDNKTILDNQLKIIKKFFPNSNIIMVCGFERDHLMNSSPQEIMKIENEHYETTNVVRSLGLALRCVKRDVMVIYGDLVFNEECLKVMNLNKSSVLAGYNIMSDSEIGCIDNQGYLQNMMYDLPNKWGQIAFFKNKELKLLKEICWKKENFNTFGFEAINQIINNGGKFIMCGSNKAKAIDIDSSKDLERVKEII